jgi:hypothetical protein
MAAAERPKAERRNQCYGAPSGLTGAAGLTLDLGAFVASRGWRVTRKRKAETNLCDLGVSAVKSLSTAGAVEISRINDSIGRAAETARPYRSSSF